MGKLIDRWSIAAKIYLLVGLFAAVVGIVATASAVVLTTYRDQVALAQNAARAGDPQRARERADQTGP